MPTPVPLEVHRLNLTIRFIQGYRYLDRCGETLIRLERALSEGWIPVESTPANGSIKNDQLGMTASFNSGSLAVQQSEFISFEHFRDQACTIYDILWPVLEVEKIIAPAARVIFQRGFEEDKLAEAEKYLRSLNLCTPADRLVSFLGGQQSGLSLTLVTEREDKWDGVPVCRRRRLEASVIRQERSPSFDSRLLQRAKLLSKGQREAMQALLKMREKHSRLAPIAAQFELEEILEEEFPAKGFDLPGFLQGSWEWANRFAAEVPGRKNGNG